MNGSGQPATLSVLLEHEITAHHHLDVQPFFIGPRRYQTRSLPPYTVVRAAARNEVHIRFPEIHAMALADRHVARVKQHARHAQFQNRAYDISPAQ